MGFPPQWWIKERYPPTDTHQPATGTTPFAPNLQLEDGRWVKGFICEPYALDGARDITGFGDWHAFIASQQR
ncbi:hypothetical protein E8F11_30010 [Pseudomonas sp. BN417]|nr:hypothetical protein [Pseudomonas sp. BN417]